MIYLEDPCWTLDTKRKLGVKKNWISLFFGSKTDRASLHEESLPHRPPYYRWACKGCAGNEPLVPRRADCRRESHIRDLRGTSPQHLAAPTPRAATRAPKANPFGHTSHPSSRPVLVPCPPLLATRCPACRAKFVRKRGSRASLRRTRTSKSSEDQKVIRSTH